MKVDPNAPLTEMTIRTAIAMHIAAGLAADPELVTEEDEPYDQFLEDISSEAVYRTDALIAKLNEEPQ